MQKWDIGHLYEYVLKMQWNVFFCCEICCFPGVWVWGSSLGLSAGSNCWAVSKPVPWGRGQRWSSKRWFAQRSTNWPGCCPRELRYTSSSVAALFRSGKIWETSLDIWDWSTDERFVLFNMCHFVKLTLFAPPPETIHISWF
jgi:hypothetical protein